MINRPAVLVTRPAGQAGQLCAAITAAGYPVYSEPMLQLEPLEELPAASRRTILALDKYQHVIFVSGNAVVFGMPLIEDYWPQLPLGLAWYAVGETTARLLREYGVCALSPARDMSSEGLLALDQLREVRDQRVLIVKGLGGRATLREELSRCGASVDELACYQRKPPALAPGELAARLRQWDIGLLMVSSGEGLANMLALLSPEETSNFVHMTLFVPSNRVAQMAREAGFEQVVTADNASDDAMLRALAQWQTNAGE